MEDHCTQKTNIVLSDYNYQRDIANRSFIAELSVSEVDVLREILDGPLKTSAKQIASHIDNVTPKQVIQVLKKLSPTQLVRLEGETVHVDKEMRKYYESQILKFDDNFTPDMEFLQGALSKVPIHELINWYSIPRSSDNIFESIVENYLKTPRLYKKYLSNVKFDNSVLNHIKKDVFAAEDFKVCAKTLMKKYSLSREKFEEYMLLLEFNLVCCLGYSRSKDQWEEIVTPFHEWRNYLLSQHEAKPKGIAGQDAVERVHPHDFGFVRDLIELLEMAHEEDIYPDTSSQYVCRLIEVMEGLKLGEMHRKALKVLPGAEKWLLRPIQEQALTVYRFGIHDLCEKYKNAYTRRDIGELERSLRGITRQGWVDVEEFLNGLSASMATADKVVLTKKGKKWAYIFPDYQEEDYEFLRAVLFGPLFEAGIISIGTYDGEACLYLTPFGKASISE